MEIFEKYLSVVYTHTHTHTQTHTHTHMHTSQRSNQEQWHHHMDYLSVPQNPILHINSFSQNLHTVSRCGWSVLRQLEVNNLVSVKIGVVFAAPSASMKSHCQTTNLSMKSANGILWENPFFVVLYHTEYSSTNITSLHHYNITSLHHYTWADILTSFLILVVSRTPVWRSCINTLSAWNWHGLFSSFGWMHLSGYMGHAQYII